MEKYRQARFSSAWEVPGVSSKLTDFTVKQLPVPERGQITVWDDGSPLGVRVSDGGAKTFIVMLGSGKRHTIGRYPVVKLAEAREAANRLKAEKILGRIFPEAMSLAQARKEYLAQITVRQNTRLYYERTLDRLKAAKLSDITPRDITRILDALGRSSADQALASLRAFFKWCLRRHYLERSPCELMTLGKPKSRARVLSTDELKVIWEATADQTNFSTIIRLLILWGQRPRETAALHSDYITEDTINLPGWLCKNGRDHSFPIGPLAANLLAAIAPNSSGLLFPARGKSEQPFNGWSKSQVALNEKLGSKVAPWQLRDIRRTYRTIHAQIGTPPHVAERLINHVSSTSEVEKIYDRFTYMPDMKLAVQKYHTHLSFLLPSS